MSKVHEKLSDIQTVYTPTGAPMQGRLRHMVYKIEDDKDAEELNQTFSEGVEISMVSQEYVFVRKFEKSKIA